MDNLRKYLVSLPRHVKALIAVAIDFCGFALCAAGAYWIANSAAVSAADLMRSIVIFSITSIAVIWVLGLYRSVIRYIGLDLLLVAVKISAIASVVGGLGALTLLDPREAIRWAVTLFAFSLIYVCSSRYLPRLFLLNLQARRQREQVIIYGAGSAAAQLIPSLLSNDEYLPVALVDDDPGLQGSRVKGIEVHSSDKVESLIQKLNATRVLLAMPSASSLSSNCPT